MGATPGLLSFASNLSVQYAGHLDSRLATSEKADLTNAANFNATDGSSYLFPGFFCLVYADAEPSNNGFYWLRQLPATEAANWVQVSGGAAGADYETLINKPSINNVELSGNKTAAELGLGTINFVTVDTLPELTAAEKNVIYLVPNPTDNTIKDEWIAVEDPASVTDPKELMWEKIGSTDLSGYVTDDEIIFAETEGTAVALGGLPAGSVITDQNVLQVLSAVLFPELFPTLSNPAANLISDSPSLVESGIVKDIVFTASFNPGSINPQYSSASPNRAGAPNNYVFVGAGLPANLASTEMSITQTVSNHSFSTLGPTSWTVKVSFDEGVQAMSNKGNPYSTPLAAGDTPVKILTINTVNPLFASTETIGTLTKQPLVAPGVAYIEIDFVGEDDANKAKFQFGRERGSVTKIEQLNTLSGKFETVATNTFTSEDADIEINGINQPYTTLTHNGAKIGARTVRFYF